LDSNFRNIPLEIGLSSWAAVDLYIDGEYVQSWGNTGLKGGPFQENRSRDLLPVSLEPNIDHVLAFHLIDYTTPLKHSDLKIKTSIFFTTERFYDVKRGEYLQEASLYFTLYLSVAGVLCLLFWLLYFQNTTEKVLLFIALSMIFFALAAMSFLFPDCDKSNGCVNGC
jgi:hypothetical protein